jgi:hypothetical protein
VGSIPIARSRNTSITMRELPPNGPSTMSRPPNGVMYAVAIRDADRLWLFARISRSRDGSVSVLPPRDDPRFSAVTPGTSRRTRWNPHATYHRSGEWHIRSYNGKPIRARPLLITERQKLDASFRDVETVIALPIQPGEAALHKAPCVAREFNSIFEIPIEQFGQGEHHTLVVDLVEPGRSAALGPWREIIVQRSFQDAAPWILVTLWRGMTL